MKKLNVHPPSFDVQNCASLAVAVLAGGASSRFGADKALVRICGDGPTLLERVVDAGRNVSSNLFIVGHERYAPYVSGVHIVPDDFPGEGPLAGIRSALGYTSAHSLLVLACDAPCLSIPLLGWMASIETTADAVVPRTSDGRWQPMPAIYRRTALPAIERSLQKGNRAIASVFASLNVREITEDELRGYDPELNSLISLNSPDQLERARACLSCN